ncbi:hypothetical protein [Leptospira harrisiae]|uniref:Uncharacterized protein n=1 Tax=Leptospira harrisiae TaxID=2023189 RepID=A0A2N0AM76_9LEPT|nr:hypothetical protein [Leptospira harrisiae]PJZ85383.1 hypothetical protein CH364_03850 [Leptospira harrisiae]PKA08919.1 hypothetical protein CH366_03990 [Leptospira harrisiae]
MKFRIIFLFLSFFLNLAFCKKQELTINDEDPFYLDLEAGCFENAKVENSAKKVRCITKKDELACFILLRNANSNAIDQVFKNTKWTSPNFSEASLNYYIDKMGTISVLQGGPARTKEEYLIIGEGKIHIKNSKWFYEQFCDQNNCERLTFAIEYFNCSVSYFPASNEHRLFLTIGDRNFGDSDNAKSLSIVLEDPVKPQIRNGFELYLVPPDSK